MENQLAIAVVNMHAKSGEKARNLRAMLDMTLAAGQRGIQLLLFPELCLQGYDLYVNPAVDRDARRAEAEPLGGPSCRAMAEAAAQAGCYVVFGMAELAEDGHTLYNTAAAISPEGAIAGYRKIHPFAEENLAFAKGDAPLLLDTPWGPVGVGICYDTYQFPELMRHYAHRGARLYLNPTALSEETHRPDSRRAFIRYYKPTLAYGVLANTIYVASANLTGRDSLHDFGGGSMVIGPKATEFYETDVACYAGDADETRPGMFSATIDLSLATRRLFVDNPLTGAPDFRPEIYKKLL